MSPSFPRFSLTVWLTCLGLRDVYTVLECSVRSRQRQIYLATVVGVVEVRETSAAGGLPVDGMKLTLDYLSRLI